MTPTPPPRLRRGAAIGLAVTGLVLLIGFVARDTSAGDGVAAVAPGTPMRVEPPRAASRPARAPARPALPARTIDRALQERLRAHVSAATAKAAKDSKGRAKSADVTVAVHVREVGRGGELVALNAGRALRPASNMKLVTSAAALVLLGPDFHFETAFETSAGIEAGVLRGDLVVRAGADPLYDPDAEGRVSGFLDPAIAELRAAGVRRIEGNIVLDEGTYLEPGPAPGWPSDNQWWQEYCARCAGFSANAGCLTARVDATRPGERARVSVHPLHHGLERNGVVNTGRAKSTLSIAVEARPPRVTVRGSLPVDVPSWSARFAHPDPVELFGSCLAGALADGGVELGGDVVRTRAAPPGSRLAAVRSPLVPLLSPINAESNNAVTDQLFLALGAAAAGAGDRDGGARATRTALERLGVPVEGLVQVDGSGLSRENRVSAEQISALVAAVMERDDRSAQAFFESLASAGESGTLEHRMQAGPARGRVRAKTGWIGGTSALSGLAQTGDGRTLAFSILVDYPIVSGLNTSCWKPMQDRICEELVAFDG